MARLRRSPADGLRDVPPREFVGARTALAARLAREGKTTEARQVARLRRPSPVVWALNRVAMLRPRDIQALVGAVDRLRRAQLGGGDLRSATADYRAELDALVRAAGGALKEAGTTVSAALDRRLRSTLVAAVTDRRLRADLGAGRLADELADPGFAVLGAPVSADVLRPRTRRTRAPRAGSEEPSVVRQRPAPKPAEARRLARQQARAAREGARHARALERKAQQAERSAVRTERRVEAMRRALQALEQRSASLRAAADLARRAHAERGKIP